MGTSHFARSAEAVCDGPDDEAGRVEVVEAMLSIVEGDVAVISGCGAGVCTTAYVFLEEGGG